MALNLCVCWAYRTDIFVVLFLRFLLHLHRHSSRTYQCAIMSVLNVFLFSILNYCSIVSPLNACVCTFQFASTNITHECELIQFHIIIPYSYKWNLNTRFIDMFAVWEMMIELYQYTLLPPVNVRTQTDWQFPFIPFWINQVLCHMTTIDDVIFFLFVLSNPINGYWIWLECDKFWILFWRHSHFITWLLSFLIG